LLGAGLLWLVASPPRGEPVYLSPPSAPGPISVHVTGAVHTPGLYSLPPDARVSAAIEAAGGFQAEARVEAVNLAARLIDGEQIRVPARPATPSAAETDRALPPGSPAVLENQPGLIDLNTAGAAELERLPGVGPVTAAKIVAYREAQGPFTSIDQIQRVSGIGPASYEALKDLVTVGDTP
jgi:competence protein ComEA